MTEEDFDELLAIGHATRGVEFKGHAWIGAHVDLIARPRELAAEAARELFQGFGFDQSLTFLARIQEMIGR